MNLYHDEVEVVLGAEKDRFLEVDPYDVRIQASDGLNWMVPTPAEVELLHKFVRGEFKGGPAKFWSPATGTRLVCSPKGICLNTKHVKRFFGLPPALAPARKTPYPNAAPTMTRAPTASGGSTMSLLNTLAGNIETVSDDARSHMLRATFRAADSDSNGYLNKAELGSMLRKMVTSLSSQDVDTMMALADKNNDGKIDYNEFVEFLQERAPDNISKAVRSVLSRDSDLVRVAFRVWDRDGDGTVSRKGLQRLLNQMCPTLSQDQCAALINGMDANNDGIVDYDEFVDFLFGE
jgi:Ca2+-binding EF-hand superfamily protein